MKKKFWFFFTVTVVLFAMVFSIYFRYVYQSEYRIFIEELVEVTGKTEEEAVKSYGGEESIKKTMLIDEITKLIYEINTFQEKTTK